MLTLHKTADAVPLVNMHEIAYHGKGKLADKSGQRAKRQVGTVYFTHEDDEGIQNVGKASGVLHLHQADLQKRLHISKGDFEIIYRMLDDDAEPDLHHELRHQYWAVKHEYDRFLRREMFLGDEADLEFELNLPRKKDDWPGTMTLIGNSGAGKTRFLTDMLLRHLKGTPAYATRTIIWLSPELEIDKTLEAIKSERFNMFFHGIDISEKALRESKLDAGSYFKTKIQDVIETRGENALVCYDDFPDGARSLYPYLLNHYLNLLRVARHKNMGIYSLQHTYAGGKNTSQALQSNKYIVFFPRSQHNRCITFMRDHLMMQTTEAKDIVVRFARLGRYMVIQMHSPVCIFNNKYLILL